MSGMSFGFAVEFEDRVTGPARSANRALKALIKTIVNVQSAAGNSPAWNAWASGLASVTAAATAAAGGMRQTRSALGGLGRGFSAVQTPMRQAGQQMEFWKRSFLGANISIWTHKMYAGISGVVDGLGSLVEAGARVETQLQDVAILVSGAGDPKVLKELEDESARIASINSKSQTEVLAGMAILGQQGADAKKVLAQVGDVLNLSVVGGRHVDTEKAAMLISRAMNLYTRDTMEANKQLKNSAAAADAFTKASNVTNYSVHGLGSAITSLGSAAANQNLSMEEAIGYMNLFKGAGNIDSVTGRVLGKVLTEISIGGKKVSSALQGTGVSLSDISPKVVGARTALENMNKVFGGPDGLQRAVKAFGRDGERVNTAMGGWEKSYDDYTANMLKAASAQEVATKKGNTLASQWGRLKNKIEPIGKALTDAFDPIFGPFLQKVNTLVENLMPVMQKFFVWVAESAKSFFDSIGVWSGALRVLSTKNTEESSSAIREVLQQLIIRFAYAKLVVMDFVGGVREGFGEAVGEVGKFLKPLGTAIKGLLEHFGLLDAKKGFGAKEIGKIVGWFTVIAGVMAGIILTSVVATALFAAWPALFVLGAALIVDNWKPILDLLGKIGEALEKVMSYTPAGLWLALKNAALNPESKVGQAAGLVSATVTPEEIEQARRNLRMWHGGQPDESLRAQGLGPWNQSVPTENTTPPQDARAPLMSVTEEDRKASVASAVNNNNQSRTSTVNVQAGAVQVTGEGLEGGFDEALKKLTKALVQAQRLGEGMN